MPEALCTQNSRSVRETNPPVGDYDIVLRMLFASDQTRVVGCYDGTIEELTCGLDTVSTKQGKGCIRELERTLFEGTSVSM